MPVTSYPSVVILRGGG